MSQQCGRLLALPQRYRTLQSKCLREITSPIKHRKLYCAVRFSLHWRTEEAASSWSLQMHLSLDWLQQHLQWDLHHMLTALHICLAGMALAEQRGQAAVIGLLLSSYIHCRSSQPEQISFHLLYLCKGSVCRLEISLE